MTHLPTRLLYGHNAGAKRTPSSWLQGFDALRSEWKELTKVPTASTWVTFPVTMRAADELRDHRLSSNCLIVRFRAVGLSHLEESYFRSETGHSHFAKPPPIHHKP